jgi:hypothetical protein
VETKKSILYTKRIEQWSLEIGKNRDERVYNEAQKGTTKLLEEELALVFLQNNCITGG